MRPQYESAKGIFVFSLCDNCNNTTGHRYGADYSRFTEIVASSALPANVDTSVVIDVSKLHPLRIVKQATSMMLSTSNPTSFTDHDFVSAPGKSRRDLDGIKIDFPTKERQLELYYQLRRFVRLRDSNEFPSGVRIYMFASVGRPRGFSTGIFTLVNLKTRSAIFAVSTGLYPIHWVFSLDGQLDESIVEVTDWAGYGYKETFAHNIHVPMRWLEGHYPLDFRSPQDLNTFNFVHSMEMEGFIASDKQDKDKRLEEALYFARALGRTTAEGYLISSFATGTFYECDSINGWLPEADASTALIVLKNRLKSRQI